VTRLPRVGAREIGYGLLVLALIVAVAMWYAGSRLRPELIYDEGVTFVHTAYSSETLAELREGTSSLYATWIGPESWRPLYEPGKVAPLATFRAVARTDNHPPAYFVLLNAWRALVGPTFFRARLLNMLLGLALILCVFGLVDAALDSKITAGVSALAVALLPGVATSVLTVRQYVPLALLAVALAWQSVRIAQSKRVRWWAWLLLGTTALLGFLTHLYFVLPSFAMCVWVVARLVGSDRRRAALFTAVLAGAALLSLPTSPSVFSRAAGSYSGARSADVLALAGQIRMVRETFAFGIWAPSEGLLATPKPVGATGIAIGTLALAFVLASFAFLVAGLVRDRRVQPRRDVPEPTALLAYGVGGFLGVFALSLAVPDLSRALYPRYFAMAWPGLVMLVAAFGSYLPRFRWLPVLALSALLALGVFSFLSSPLHVRPGIRYEPKRVVIDNVGRGHVARFLMALRDSPDVYAAWRRDLVARPEPWLNRLQTGDVLVLLDEDQVDGTPRSAVLDLVRGRFALRRLTGVTIPASVYRLEPLESAP